MQRINPGDKGIQAATWNKFADTAKAFIQAPPQTDVKRSRGAAALRVSVENQTGDDITVDYPILAISDPIFNVADRDTVIYEAIQLQGTTPDETTPIDNIAIIQGPIPDGEFRPAVLQGVTWVQINWTDAQHTCALPKAGDSTALKSATTGIKILWHETPASYPALIWAIADLGKAAAITSGDIPVINIVNISGVKLFNRSLVGIGAPLVQPNGSFPTPDQLPNQPIFYSAPVDAHKPFAIILGEVENNDIVQAITVGTWAVQLNVIDAKHQWAIPQNGNNVWMNSSHYGTSRILWKQDQDKTGNAALGLQWAFIETPWIDPGDPDVRAITTSTGTAATGYAQGNISPGVGFALLYSPPSANSIAGTAWTVSDPRQVVLYENWSPGTVAVNKTVLLRRGRLNPTDGTYIYALLTEPCTAIGDSPGSGQ